MVDVIRSSRLAAVAISLALAATLTRTAAGAEEPAGEALQEITVTAQKREQSLQSVGTSITALDGATLNRLGLSNVTSLASQTPGMQFNQFSPTITVYNLRGVSQNDFSDHQEAPIAVYSDDAYVASMGALAGAMYDLARVEVLRGPQGTLFGRNATGGLIHYISEKPKFDTEGNVTVTGGNFSTWNSEGAFNTALTDTLAARLSFATDYHDGYISNSVGRSVGNQRQYAARTQFLYKPTDRAEILLNLHGVVNDHETGAGYSWAASHPDATGRGVLIGPTSTANCPNLDGGCTPGGDLSGYRNPSSNPFNQALGRPGIFNRTVGGATLHITWNFDPFTLTSVTDYLRMQKRYGEDSATSPNPILVYDTLQHYHQLSQELRLNGGSGALKWIAGLYSLDYHTRNNQAVSADPAIGGLSDAAFALTTQSEAAFGQIEYDFSQNLTGIIGTRYSSDQKTFDFVYTNAPQVPVVYNEATNPAAAHTYDNVSGKAEIDYKVIPGSMLYASVNRGAKGGGWSAPINGVVDPNTLDYKQETLTSYEVGEKLTFWDGRARLNSAVFYYDYRNYQGFFLQGLANVVKNVDAKVKGGELEFAWAPVRGANLQLGVSHLETTAQNVPLPAGGLTDTQLPQAPKWSVNALARYEWSMPVGRMALEADTKWNSSQYMELINAPADYEGSYAVANARITYSNVDDHWEVAGWVRNLTDRWYKAYGLDLSALGFEQSVYGPPRTYGATFTYRWGP
jgi:iron complex outermembrane receptor protein